MFSDTFRVLKTTRFKKETRAALLASKRAIDAKQVSNKDELLRSSAVREKQDLNEKVACVLFTFSVGLRLTACSGRTL